MAREAATKALADAKIHFNEVKQAVVGYVYGLLNNNLVKFENIRSLSELFIFRGFHRWSEKFIRNWNDWNPNLQR